MKSRLLITAAGVAIATAVILIGNLVYNNPTDRITNPSLNGNPSGTPVDAGYAGSTGDESFVLPTSFDSTPARRLMLPSGPELFDIVRVDSVIYGILEDGLLVHNMKSGQSRLIPIEVAPGAIVRFNNDILVGADRLYKLAGDSALEDQFVIDLDGIITALSPYEAGLLIGTSDGLFLMEGEKLRQLASSVYVTALAVDPHGLWVGTAGQGLYFWNGETFQQRYLKRDTTLFDNVVALDYGHDHLYLGTDKGLFIYDGGSWKQFTTGDGLPSDLITAIDASDWSVMIGTENGAVKLHDGLFAPITQFDGVIINRFMRYHKGLLTATAGNGLVLKPGALATVIFDGKLDTPLMVMDQD